ncbi:MAG: PadR family transcriptional regulator [Roseburia sp.]|nr:PadR family transcriptional regulator [Roseburia sp.]
MAQSDLIRGNVDTVILKVLYEGDRYGYDLTKRINERSGGLWEVKQSTVYAYLKSLEKQGFVTSYWDSAESAGGRRKYFSLTDSGREVFIKYKNEWERSRDLFGELITGSTPIMPSDDFADVEEESYSVPKRRVPRERRAAPKKTAEAAQTEAAAAEQTPAEQPAPEQAYNQDSPLPYGQTDVGAEPAEQPETAEPDGYVQTSFFDDAGATQTTPDNGVSDDISYYAESANEKNEKTEQQMSAYRDSAERQTVSAADPHEMMREIYASTYTGGKSYSDAHASLLTYDNDGKRAAQAAKPTAAAETEKPAETHAVAPAPIEQSAPAPQSSDASLQPVSGNLPDINSESRARREYKYVLSDLVERFESASPLGAENSAPTGTAEQAAVAAEKTEVTRFYKIEQAVRELGNDVTVREHSDTSREYTHKFYYYSNRLMMMHYMIMCSAMFLVGLVVFLTLYTGLHMRMRYDYVLYLVGGLLPIVMFITAVAVFALNPDKKKRINVNFKFFIIIRLLIMIQVAVVIYCLNLIWGMPVKFSADYIPSLVLPLAYALFIPISEIIFMALLKSARYAVE